MKFLFCTHDFDGGGAARSLFVLVKHLIILGHEVRIVTFQQPDPNKKFLAAYKVWKVPVLFFQWVWLTGKFKNLDINLKNTSEYRKKNRHLLPIVQELSRNVDAVCFNGYPSASLAANLECRINVLIAREQLDDKDPRHPALAAYLARNTTKAVAISPAEAKQLTDMGIANRIIFNAAHEEPVFAPLPEFPLRFGVFGQLYPPKGARTLVTACALTAVELRQSDATVHIFGGAPQNAPPTAEQTYLQQRINELHIDDIVHLEGWTDKVEECMRSVHWIVRPDHDGSPWGRDVLEAMSLGRPVLATGQEEYFISHGKNGFLVPPKDALALSRALRVIIKHKESTYTYAQAAFDFAHREFDPEIQAAKFVEWVLPEAG